MVDGKHWGETLEGRIKMLLDYFRGDSREYIYKELVMLSQNAMDEKNIEQIVLLTNVREKWLTEGEGDAFRGKR